MKILEEIRSYKQKFFGQVCCNKMQSQIRGGTIHLDSHNGKVSLVHNNGMGYDLILEINYCPFCGEKIE